MLVLFAHGCSPAREERRSPASPEQAAASVPRFGIFELALRSDARPRNPFIDVTLDADFRSPDGARIAAPGFYYGGGRWMIRFRPRVPGHWTYDWRLAFGGASDRGSGAFECTLPAAGNGAVRRAAGNPYRWAFEDGTSYFPIGLQEGINPDVGRGFLIDGEGRSGPRRRVSPEEYFRIYGGAGFNLFRFSQRNSTYALFDDLDHYREAESIATDRLLGAAHRAGFQVMFGFFGTYSKWSTGGSRWRRGLDRLVRLYYLRPEEAIDRPRDFRTMAKEKRFIRYCVARWGVYADFWELLNERHASSEWINEMAAYAHAIDPEQGPVGTSWEKPDVPAIGITAPHWYETENELDSDLRVAQIAARWKRFPKPVLIGEQGNSGMNWDPRSGVRMRIRLWTALFQEIGLVFWNTAWSKAGMHLGRYSPGAASNIYLGPEERGYVRALADFSAQLDVAMKIADARVYGSGVRAYVLASPRATAAYLHHFSDHESAATGVKISVPLANGRPAAAQWIDPATGKILGRSAVPPGGALAVPPFRVDLALLVKK